VHNSPYLAHPRWFRTMMFPPLSFDDVDRGTDLISIVYAPSSGIVPKLTQFQCSVKGTISTSHCLDVLL
jgi:hypothetical protein